MLDEKKASNEENQNFLKTSVNTFWTTVFGFVTK